MTDNSTLAEKTSKSAGAMLGAAFGDALGWPNERIAKSNAAKQPQSPLHDLKSWPRRTGGRFNPYEENIEKGTYSDDTQLILCLSRSLHKNETWWEDFTRRELPFWSVYECGGGGATKRAADSWLDGIEPWSSKRKPQKIKQYYDAGGNGVAMRILPHILYLSEKTFPEVANNIFRDGIATHGHPRALLGALAYGFALWTAFHKNSKLAYGELVEELIKNVSIWFELRPESVGPPRWMEQANISLPNYMKVWEDAKIEMMEYLEVCRIELAKGALAFDDGVLTTLQCFNKKMGGAGTVAAIASVYLASRHAADPMQGIIKAAFAIGSDTDTIASMTGGLLGCINGSDWLSGVKQQIQDTAYIEKTAFRLVAGQHADDGSTQEAIKRPFLKRWVDDVTAAPDSTEINLPDCRKAKINHDRVIIGENGKFKVESRLLTIEDGQSIRLKKISKGDFAPTSSSKKPSELFQQPPSNGRECRPKILVSSFEKSVWFYRDCLGLTVKKQDQERVIFDQGIILVSLSYRKNFPKDFQFRAIIYIQVTNISERFQCVKKSGLQIISELAPWGKSKMGFFRSLDPDGNVVEAFSADRP